MPDKYIRVCVRKTEEKDFYVKAPCLDYREPYEAEAIWGLINEVEPDCDSPSYEVIAVALEDKSEIPAENILSNAEVEVFFNPGYKGVTNE